MRVRTSKLVMSSVLALGVVVATGPSGHADDPPDTTAPTCGLARVVEGPPRAMELSVRDGESGLKSVVSTAKNKKNATITVPVFTAGSTATMTVTVAKADQTKNAQAALKVSDIAGNSVVCGPVLATVFPRGDTGKPIFVNLPESAHVVTVYNASPGLTKLAESVNGVQFTIDPIQPGQVASIDVATEMNPGDVNTIVLRGQGSAGAVSEILVWDGRG